MSEIDSGVCADNNGKERAVGQTILTSQSLNVRGLDSFEARHGVIHPNSKHSGG